MVDWCLARLSIATVVALFCRVTFCPFALAGGGHGEDAAISESVDTKGKAGINLFLANLYNDQRLLYGLLVTATMSSLSL